MRKKMRKVILPLLVVSVCTAHFAWASDESMVREDTDPTAVPAQQAGMAAPDDTSNSSTAKSSDMKAGGLRDEVFGIKPAVGALNFRDGTGAISNRGLIGLTADLNATSLAANVLGMQDAKWMKNLYVGPSTGFIYSHLGPATADFFGTSGSVQTSGLGDAGSNMFFVPLNLKIGYNLGNFRPSLHGGANMFYRSVANSIQLGYNPDQSTGSAVSFIPNFGADLEYGLTNRVAVILRPDLSFGGSNSIWAATLGVSIPLG